MSVVSRIVKCRGKDLDNFGPRFFYCGRRWAGYEESILANHHTTHGTCQICDRAHTVADSIAAFRKDLWHALTKGAQDYEKGDYDTPECRIAEVLYELPTGIVLGCWCTTTDEPLTCTTCHCGVIARALDYLQSIA